MGRVPVDVGLVIALFHFKTLCSIRNTTADITYVDFPKHYCAIDKADMAMTTLERFKSKSAQPIHEWKAGPRQLVPVDVWSA